MVSSYPSKRAEKDDKGKEEGVMGKVSLLQNVTFSSQPISSMDWSPDKVMWVGLVLAIDVLLQEGLLVSTSFDQTVRVCIVTKLNTQ